MENIIEYKYVVIKINGKHYRVQICLDIQLGKRIDEFYTEIPKFIGEGSVDGEVTWSGNVTVREVLPGDAF